MTSGEPSPHAYTTTTGMDDVRDAHAGWWNALLVEDVTALDTLLADDLTFHSPSGYARTKAHFLENLRSGRLAYDSITAEEPSIRVHGASAIVTGKADILFQSQGQPRTEGLYYTAVYGWTSSRWRMLAWQSTMRADARA